jgi:hypothetical protein
MTAIPDPAYQAQHDPTVPLVVPADQPAHTGGSRSEVRPEDPKRNPVTYIALAIAVLALLLSILALTRHTGPRQIDVGGKRCIVQRIDGNNADTLFCQT